MSERDPRVGDIYKRGNRQREIVPVIPLGREDRQMDWVAFQTISDKRRGLVSQERPDIFARWAKGAEVIRRAEDETTEKDSAQP